MSTFRRYVLAKAGWYLLAFLLAVALNFYLPRLIPGNPVTAIVSRMVAGGVSAESLERIYATYVREFGLDQPVHIQFLTYISGVLRGDLGTSFMLHPAKVEDLIGQALPWTIALQLPAILVGWILGNVLGAVAAYKGGRFDSGVFTTSLIFSNIPYYGLAILLLYLLAVQVPLFPTGGGYTYGSIPSFSWSFLADAAVHYVLPFLSLVLVAIGGQAIGMREMALYEVSSDYIQYGKMLGMKDRKLIRYVFRNASLPQITGVALSLGTMVAGALITETVFSYPGIGSLLFTAIRQSDYPLIQGITLLVSVAVLLANFAVDLVYGLVDPRIRAAQRGER